MEKLAVLITFVHPILVSMGNALGVTLPLKALFVMAMLALLMENALQAHAIMDYAKHVIILQTVERICSVILILVLMTMTALLALVFLQSVLVVEDL
jgi:hypothetical protein